MQAFSIRLLPHNAPLCLLWQASSPAAPCQESHSQVARLWSEAPAWLGLIWTSGGLVGEAGQRQWLSIYRWPQLGFVGNENSHFTSSMDWKSNRKRVQFSNLKLLLHRKLGPNGTELFMSIFSSISQSSDWQHGRAGPSSTGGLGREQFCCAQKKGKHRDLRKCLQYGLEGAEYICNHKKPFWPPLQFFCFCPRSPPAIFWFCNLSHHARQREHKQPYSKINTAILCVFTFHSAASICDSVPQTVLFHFTPRGRPSFLAHCTDERAR